VTSIVERIWAYDASLWTDSGEDQWLGWLDVVPRVSVHVDELNAFSEAATSIIAGAPAPAGEEPRPLAVEAWVDGDELGVRLSHPSQRVSRPEADVGHGFGLAIIARVCDRFEVRRRDERPGTAWLMIFRLEREPERSFRLQPSRSSPRR